MFLNFLLFLALTFLSFTIPGLFFLEKSKEKFNFWEKTVLGTVLGFILFTLLSYILLILKIHFLLFPILLVINFLFFKRIRNYLKGLSLPSKKHLIMLFLVFTTGIIGQLAVIAPSGMTINNDIVFWSAHGHDGIWHIALVEELKKGFPLQNPVMANNKLVNYHFFSDIAIADFSKYFNFSTLDLFFRFFPFIFSILLGALSFMLGCKLGKSFNAGIWASIFTYFTGSFGYIVTLSRNEGIGGESLFWVSQIQSAVGNPPQMIALIIILAFLNFFFLFLNNKNKLIFLACVLLIGILAVIKIYAAIVMIGGISAIALSQFAKERKLVFLCLLISSGLLSAILYLPYASKTTSFLIWEPWWFIRTLVVATDRLNWLDLELRRQTYILENNWKRVIQLELTAFSIFFFGNLGMRFIGIWHFIKMIKTAAHNYFFQLLIFITIISFVLPILFLQKGVASNTSQFFQYFLLLFGITAGITTAAILDKVKINIIRRLIAGIIILLAMPTQLGLINNFYSRPPFAKVEPIELQALQFLKENTDTSSVILTPPYNKELKAQKASPLIWEWSDTAYISALTARRTYLSDIEQADIMGYEWREKSDIQKAIFKETDSITFTEYLKTNKIDYLYFPKILKPAIDLSTTNLKPVFANDNFEIWQVATY